MSIETIGQLVDAAAREHADRTYLFFEDRTYTFGQLKAQTDIAAGSFAAHGIRHGDCAAVMLPNCPELLFLWLGLMKIGAVLLPMNPAARIPEVAGLLGQANPRVAITDAAGVAVVQAAVDQCGSGLPVYQSAEFLSGAEHFDPVDTVKPDDVAILIHTSGTTGSAKLVMQTHRTYVLSAQGFPYWLGLTERDRLMTPLPLFHVNAQAYSTLGSLAAGASLVLLPRFSAHQFWDQARHYGATQFNAIGAIVEILMRQPPRPDDTEHSVRLCYTAPAPSMERHLEIERRFGVRVLIGYALSESTYGTVWPLTGPPPYTSMGVPRQHPTLGEINRARVVDDQDRDVAVGEIGELLLRNPAVMKGYLGLAEETARVLRDGWLHTGDLVRMDDAGLLYFVARKKEVIRRRGENLAPAEVEAVLNSYPGVAESAVVGVPAELSDEEVKAFILLAPGAVVELGALRAWSLERLAAFKVPRYLEIVPELPRTPTERIAKHLLSRERTASEYDAESPSH
jgi:crotonobetaine/carnitine-CoA ligase